MDAPALLLRHGLAGFVLEYLPYFASIVYVIVKFCKKFRKSMTDKLYYQDSHLAEFQAAVLSCAPSGEGCWAVTLDRTAFFPEGGGQSADTGFIGATAVTDVREKDGEIVHYAAGPLTKGETCPCRIDWPQRFSRMQNHSGEHIVSGLVHKLYGYDNVGFHMDKFPKYEYGK